MSIIRNNDFPSDLGQAIDFSIFYSLNQQQQSINFKKKDKIENILSSAQTIPIKKKQLFEKPRKNFQTKSNKQKSNNQSQVQSIIEQSINEIPKLNNNLSKLQSLSPSSNNLNNSINYSNPPPLNQLLNSISTPFQKQKPQNKYNSTSAQLPYFQKSKDKTSQKKINNISNILSSKLIQSNITIIQKQGINRKKPEERQYQQESNLLNNWRGGYDYFSEFNIHKKNQLQIIGKSSKKYFGSDQKEERIKIYDFTFNSHKAKQQQQSEQSQDSQDSQRTNNRPFFKPSATKIHTININQTNHKSIQQQQIQYQINVYSQNPQQKYSSQKKTDHKYQNKQSNTKIEEKSKHQYQHNPHKIPNPHIVSHIDSNQKQPPYKLKHKPSAPVRMQHSQLSDGQPKQNYKPYQFGHIEAPSISNQSFYNNSQQKRISNYSQQSSSYHQPNNIKKFNIPSRTKLK